MRGTGPHEAGEPLPEVAEAMMRLVPVVPYGYQIVDGSLVPEPREQEAIAIVRDGRARGVSFVKLAEELRERGATTRMGRPFRPSAVWTIAKALDAAEPQEGRAA